MRAVHLAASASLACLGLLAAAPRAHADEGGLSLMVLSLGKDSASQKAAATGAFVARGVFARNPRYQPLDLEPFLEGSPDSPGRAAVTRGLQQLERGGHALDENELDTAIASLNDAAVAFEQGAAYADDLKPYVTALLKLGSAYALNAEPKPAAQAFTRALLVDRNAAWEQMPAQARKPFDEAARKVDEADRRSISIFSTPSAAEVYVDGTFRGATPQVIDRLPAGPHIVRLVRPGHRSAGRVVKVSAADETVQFPLKPTMKAAELENITNRVHGDIAAGQGPALAELARFARVDQVFVMSVQSSATDVRVTAILVDGTGASLAHAERSFQGERYREELDRWIEGGFRTGQAGSKDAVTKDAPATTTTNYAAPTGGAGNPGRGKVIAGWLLVPLLPVSLVVLLLAAALSAFLLYLWLGFRLPGTNYYMSVNQPNERTVALAAAIAAPIVAVVLVLLSAGALAGGIGLIAWGNSERDSMEAILQGGGGDVPVEQSVVIPAPR